MKVALATGGTGGHIFPAIQVAEELKAQGHEVIFLGALGAAQEKIREKGFSCVGLNIQGISGRSVWKMMRSAFLMLRAIKEAWSHLKTIQPRVLAGFGGYGAFPSVLAGVFRGIPTLIHEQNVVPGRANYLLAFFVRKIAISFRETKKYFPPLKVILTGCPCRRPGRSISKEECLKTWGLKEGVFTVLVFGGSQGSQRLNEEFFKAVAIIHPQQTIQVIHLTGPRDYEMAKAFYAREGIQAVVFSFLEDMESAYTLADLVVCRSGAATIAELALFQKPAILIPYPFAQRHQRENAKVLCATGGAKMVEEEHLTPVKLANEVLAFRHGVVNTQHYHQAAGAMSFPNAAQRVAEAITALVSLL